ncbi:MAG TPA: M23 family metallopeptidase [Roseiflexaceae bacterium]|nr:M23 family metallopeptidase [Roseiflexaceae bacterium]
MIGGEWPYLTRGRQILLILALLGLGYLLLQTRQSPAQISAWSAGALPIAPVKVVDVAPGAIVAQAAPQTGRGQPGDDIPSGSPLVVPNMVMTQGYDVGSHAPAAIWGGVDLAIDGNSDGQADPDGTFGQPVYATHAGIAHVKPDTWPAGNYLAIEGEHYKTAFAHLKEYAVQDGQAVERGQIIGYIGSTGQSSGPHLHYEVWKDGVNVNPLDYGVLDQVR